MLSLAHDNFGGVIFHIFLAIQRFLFRVIVTPVPDDIADVNGVSQDVLDKLGIESPARARLMFFFIKISRYLRCALSRKIRGIDHPDNARFFLNNLKLSFILGNVSVIRK